MDEWCCCYLHSRELAVAKQYDLLMATRGANGIAWKRNGASQRSMSCPVDSAAFHCYIFHLWKLFCFLLVKLNSSRELLMKQEG